MRHTIIYLTLIFTPTILFAQTLEEKITDKFCDCFKTIDQSQGHDVVLTKYKEDCFAQTLKNFETEINQIKDTVQANTDYERGVEFGRMIGIKTQVLMIKRCDPFFHFMDNVRNGLLRNVNIDEEKVNISTKSSLIITDPSVTNYFDRALSYFRMQNFKLAKKDLDKILEIDRNFGAAYLLRGFLYEQTKKYKKAMADYEVGKKLTGKNEVDMFIAIAQRKSEHKR